MCCTSLTTPVKLIGTYGMALSILMINVLMSNFFATQEEEKFVIALESWMLFGLNWTFVMKSIRVVETARMLFACVLIYSLLYLVVNALLTLGALLKKPDYLLPWMYMQMVSIIDQTISLAVQLSNADRQDTWGFYIPACSLYLLISSYFWLLISSARREYIDNVNPGGITSISSPSVRDPNDFNLPKTPSFVSTDINAWAHEQSLASPPKYEVV